MRDVLLLAGTANPPLAEAVAAELGQPLGRCVVQRFPDGEVSVEIEETVRDRELVFLQPTSPPVDLHLMELLAFADAARRAGASRISAFVPYFGYARADRRASAREPITARLVGDLLEAAGVQHLVAVDLHTLQIEGFFRIPVDTLTAVPTLCAALRGHLPDDTVVVSPDAGRVPMATQYSQLLDLPLAVLHKHRRSGRDTQVAHLVGEVEGRACLLIDDMISTGGTLDRSMEALGRAGAREFVVASTHGLLLEDAWERLMKRRVRAVYVTDTVAVPGRGAERLHVISVAPLIADAVRHLAEGRSLRDLR